MWRSDTSPLHRLRGREIFKPGTPIFGPHHKNKAVTSTHGMPVTAKITTTTATVTTTTRTTPTSGTRMTVLSIKEASEGQTLRTPPEAEARKSPTQMHSTPPPTAVVVNPIRATPGSANATTMLRRMKEVIDGHTARTPSPASPERQQDSTETAVSPPTGVKKTLTERGEQQPRTYERRATAESAAAQTKQYSKETSKSSVLHLELTSQGGSLTIAGLAKAKVKLFEDEVRKGIQKVYAGRVTITKSTPHKKEGKVAVTLKETPTALVNHLSREPITWDGPNDMQVTIQKTKCRYVMKNISREWKTEEIKTSLEQHNRGLKISSLKPLGKRRDKGPILMECAGTVPSSLKVQRCKDSQVTTLLNEVYRERKTICFKCQAVDHHYSYNCPAKQSRCAVCARWGHTHREGRRYGLCKGRMFCTICKSERHTTLGCTSEKRFADPATPTQDREDRKKTGNPVDKVKEGKVSNEARKLTAVEAQGKEAHISRRKTETPTPALPETTEAEQTMPITTPKESLFEDTKEDLQRIINQQRDTMNNMGKTLQHLQHTIFNLNQRIAELTATCACTCQERNRGGKKL